MTEKLEPGDVLYLREDLPEVEAGTWVLLSVGEPCCLSQLKGFTPKQFCSATPLAYLPQAELAKFIPLRMKVSVAGLGDE